MPSSLAALEFITKAEWHVRISKSPEVEVVRRAIGPDFWMCLPNGSYLKVTIPVMEVVRRKESRTHMDSLSEGLRNNRVPIVVL
jgi:hypothetical protein